MKNFKIFYILLLTYILGGCSTDLKLNNYIDKSKPFILKINSLETELTVGSEKWLKLINWIEKNNKGWQPTYASYISEIAIFQDDFRLLYLNKGKGVVIGFTDEKGKAWQYSKTIHGENFDFLND